MSVIQSERTGVTARMQSPAMSPSTMATLRTGLREASHRSTPSMRAMPPSSLRRNKSSVDTCPSGGRSKIRTMRGFSAKIISRPPTPADSENTRRKMRRARYGGSGITASSRFQRLYVQERQVEPEVPREKTMLCSAVGGSRIPLITPLIHSFPHEVGMPHYEFFCHHCHKIFSKIPSLLDPKEGEILYPPIGSTEVEQRWSPF